MLDFPLPERPESGIELSDGIHLLSFPNGEHRPLLLHQKGEKTKRIPFWLSLLPPLLAIAMALLFREVLISLFVGIWAGAFIAAGMSPMAILSGFGACFEHYLLEALTDSGHAYIVLFSILIGGMVNVVYRNGGTAGIVDLSRGLAKDARSSQLASMAVGCFIFFDDYANTLIVGNTMRPITDRFKVSREKLAYIVDSTAAPVATLALVSTWIGAQLGYIESGLTQVGMDINPYTVFLGSLKYAFYPILTLWFVLLIIRSGKDFGPMLKAERKARASEGIRETSGSEEGNPKSHWGYALGPILALLLAVVWRLIQTGLAGTDTSGLGFFESAREVIGAADSYSALMWGSGIGLAVAIISTLVGRKLPFEQTMAAAMDGFKTMLTAVSILLLAWGLAATTNELHTSDFLISVIPEGLSAGILPAVFFVLSAGVAFSTGSSWSTMAILMPLGIPLVFHLGGDLATIEIVFHLSAAVLGGSVLGDHISPISDTTVLSSLATDCNHIEHVRTQMPYALVAGGISLMASILVSFGIPSWLLLLLGAAGIYAVIRFVALPVDQKG